MDLLRASESESLDRGLSFHQMFSKMRQHFDAFVCAGSGDALEGLLDKALDKASDVAGEGQTPVAVPMVSCQQRACRMGGLDTLKDKLKSKLTSKAGNRHKR